MAKELSSQKEKLSVLLIGPDINSKGGVAASIALLHGFLITRSVKAKCISTINPEVHQERNILIYLKALLAILKELLLKRTDVVHIHTASRGSFLRKSIICILCLVLRTPYIIHLHGGGFRDFYNNLSKFGKSYLRLIFKYSSSVITLSKYWQEWVAEELGPSRATVIHNGVQEITFKPEEIARTTPTVLFLGMLGKNKGTDVLIDAMRIVFKHHPNAILTLCGNGDIDAYRQQAHGLPNVQFLGWINSDERKAALGRATIYCLPSWKEGLPFSILEAMSAGLPIISTPVGSIPEAVIDEKNGFLVPPGDSHELARRIIQLLSDHKLLESMGRASRELQRQKFSFIAMGESCITEYIRAAKKNIDPPHNKKLHPLKSKRTKS